MTYSSRQFLPHRGFLCATLCFTFAVWFPLNALAQGIITTVAGGGADRSTALAALVAAPTSAAIDRWGNLYVDAAGLNEVLKIDPSGHLSVVAGTGYAGFSGDGGPAARAALYLSGAFLGAPSAIALDARGNLFISDKLNNRIRRMDAASGIITTVAGNGSAGYSGDGGPATNAEMLQPTGIALDSSGNLFISDGNDVIRRVEAATGIITTFAGMYSTVGGYSGDGGPATEALLGSPTGIAVDGSGNLFIADTNNSVIREVSASTGIISTVVGSFAAGCGYTGDGGPATNATICGPYGVSFDPAGNMFIVDTFNDVVRRISASQGIITTVAGNGTLGFSGDGSAATSAELDLVEFGGSWTSGIAADASGDIFIPDGFNNRIRRVDGATGIITTMAGGGSGGDGGPATSAILPAAVGVALDASGNLFIADSDDPRIRRVNGFGGVITTVAGTGIFGSSGDGGPATMATLGVPIGVAVDVRGDLFIAEFVEPRIRRVDASTGIITTFAGGGSCEYGVGDGGPATNACLSGVGGETVDAPGNVFIADAYHHRIRRVDAATEIITTVAGNGTAGYSGDGGLATNAQLAYPRGVALDTAGDLFIADSANNDIRRVDAATSIISTVAGNGTAGYSGDGGPATSALLNGPHGVIVDCLGNLFITDSLNNVIRRVDAVTGIITTVAGNGTALYSGDGGPATAAGMNYPRELALDNFGHLFTADPGDNRVREIFLPPFVALAPTSLAFANQPIGTSSVAQKVTLTNTGTTDLIIGWIMASGDFAETDNCGFILPGGTKCTISVMFTPMANGVQTGLLSVMDNAAESPQTVELTGTGTGTWGPW